MALVRATLREAAEARQRARQGLADHLQTDAECEILDREDIDRRGQPGSASA